MFMGLFRLYYVFLGSVFLYAFVFGLCGWVCFYGLVSWFVGFFTVVSDSSFVYLFYVYKFSVYLHFWLVLIGSKVRVLLVVLGYYKKSEGRCEIWMSLWVSGGIFLLVGG